MTPPERAGRALLYATFNGVANCTNGIGRQTKTILSTVERRWGELTTLTGPLTPYLAIPTPGPRTWAYDPDQLAAAEAIVAGQGGSIIALDHDQTAPFWSPPVWRQLSTAAAQAALTLTRHHDHVVVIAVDTPYLGTGTAHLDLTAGQPRPDVDILLTPYGTSHIHDHPTPDPARLAWESAGLAATRAAHVRVAAVGDYLTSHLIERYGVVPTRFVPWRSSLDLTSPDLTPMPRVQAERVAAAYGVPLDRPIVLFVGRTDPVKGFDLLIHALRPLAGDIHLVAVIVPFDGDDPVLAEYRQLLTQTRLRVTLVARFTRDLPRALASLTETKVVVCPSRGELLANLPFEVGMWARHGGPVVLAPALGGFTEQITDGVDGLLYHPGRPGALTAGIHRALDLDQATRQQVNHAAHQRVAASRDVVANLADTLHHITRETSEPG